MDRKHGTELLEGSKAVDSLVGPVEIVMPLPVPEEVSPFFGGFELHGVEEVFIVRSMGSFDNAVFPRLAFGNQRVDETPFREKFVERRLSGFFPFCVFHGEFPCVVSPD